MATFIALISETQKGEMNINHSVERASNFQDIAKAFGATIKGLYWTLGEIDGVVVFDAADDETAAALMYNLMSKGAVRAHLLRAFDADEMQSILKRSGV